jgi:hypothetical protein
VRQLAAARAAATRCGLAFGEGLTAQESARPRSPGPAPRPCAATGDLDLGGPGGLDGFGGGVADLGVGLVLHRLVLGHRELALRGLKASRASDGGPRPRAAGAQAPASASPS